MVPSRRAFLLGLSALALQPSSSMARNADPSRVAPASLDLVRPSQGAVGMREVAAKRAELVALARKPDKLARYLLKEALPVVKGPGGGLHLIDHHHLARALWDAGYRQANVETVADLSMHAPAAFWAEMDERGWLHAFDADGRAIAADKLPRHVRELGDDVYRSLSGAVRRAGGYGKSDVPFAEFKWADFLRSRIQRSLVSKDFDAALRQALRLTGSEAARGLPGYLGPLRKAA